MNETRGYVHQAGLHCGSSALRNLLAARGLSLSEPLVFGLGAGLGFSLHDGTRGVTPPFPERFFVGRSLAYEEDLCRILGVRLEVLRFTSPDDAWAAARRLIEQGTPPLAFTDLFHLPYLSARGHWYGHLVALAGVTDGLHANEDGLHTNDASTRVLVGDNERATLEPVPLAQLKLALSGAAAAPTDEQVLLALHDIHPLSPEALREACGRALALQARRMREPAPALHVWRGVKLLSGIAALEAFPAELRAWRGAPDLARRLRFAAQVIEVRGNGGGLFRRLYASFLREAAALGVREAEPLLPPCLASADAFTALAVELEKLRAQAADGLSPNDLDLSQAVALAAQVRDAELRFFASFASSAS